MLILPVTEHVNGVGFNINYDKFKIQLMAGKHRDRISIINIDNDFPV